MFECLGVGAKLLDGNMKLRTCKQPTLNQKHQTDKDES